MHLADLGFLRPEEIQLIADGCEHLFVLELTPLTKKPIGAGCSVDATNGSLQTAHRHNDPSSIR